MVSVLINLSNLPSGFVFSEGVSLVSTGGEHRFQTHFYRKIQVYKEFKFAVNVNYGTNRDINKSIGRNGQEKEVEGV